MSGKGSREADNPKLGRPLSLRGTLVLVLVLVCMIGGAYEWTVLSPFRYLVPATVLAIVAALLAGSVPGAVELGPRLRVTGGVGIYTVTFLVSLFLLSPDVRGWVAKRLPLSHPFLRIVRTLDPRDPSVREQPQVVVKTKTLTWTPLASLETPRSGAAAVEYEGRIYLAGGHYNSATSGEESQLPELLRFDPAKHLWTKLRDMNVGREGLSCSVLGGLIYAIGGVPDDGGQHPIVEAFDPRVNRWYMKRSAPFNCNYLRSCVLKDHLYVFASNGGEHNEVYEYEPKSDNWVKKAVAGLSRNGFGVAVVGQSLYCVGGYNGHDLGVNEESTPSRGTWFRLKRMLPPGYARNRPQLVEMGGRLWTLGPGSVEVYSPDEDSWTAYNDGMPDQCLDSAAAVLNGKLFLFGGNPDSPNGHVWEGTMN